MSNLNLDLFEAVRGVRVCAYGRSVARLLSFVLIGDKLHSISISNMKWKFKAGTSICVCGHECESAAHEPNRYLSFDY